jgi:hypothetical protein
VHAVGVPRLAAAIEFDFTNTLVYLAVAALGATVAFTTRQVLGLGRIARLNGLGQRLLLATGEELSDATPGLGSAVRIPYVVAAVVILLANTVTHTRVLAPRVPPRIPAADLGRLPVGESRGSHALLRDLALEVLRYTGLHLPLAVALLFRDLHAEFIPRIDHVPARWARRTAIGGPYCVRDLT